MDSDGKPREPTSWPAYSIPGHESGYKSYATYVQSSSSAGREPRGTDELASQRSGTGLSATGLERSPASLLECHAFRQPILPSREATASSAKGRFNAVRVHCLCCSVAPEEARDCRPCSSRARLTFVARPPRLRQRPEARAKRTALIVSSTECPCHADCTSTSFLPRRWPFFAAATTRRLDRPSRPELGTILLHSSGVSSDAMGVSQGAQSYYTRGSPLVAHSVDVRQPARIAHVWQAGHGLSNVPPSDTGLC